MLPPFLSSIQRFRHGVFEETKDPTPAEKLSRTPLRVTGPRQTLVEGILELKTSPINRSSPRQVYFVAEKSKPSKEANKKSEPAFTDFTNIAPRLRGLRDFRVAISQRIPKNNNPEKTRIGEQREDARLKRQQSDPFNGKKLHPTPQQSPRKQEALKRVYSQQRSSASTGRVKDIYTYKYSHKHPNSVIISLPQLAKAHKTSFRSPYWFLQLTRTLIMRF